MTKLTLGGGCFWCIDAVFQEMKGIQSVVSGYTGGHIKNPCYREVCNGTSGHAEVCQLTFDETIVSEETILKVFWSTHDPTTLNRQGHDRGTQYRSVIYYENEEQKNLAERVRDNFASDIWSDPIVTEISPLGTFYVAEEAHQNYFKKNPHQGYCNIIIAPKISKFRKHYSSLLKDQNV